MKTEEKVLAEINLPLPIGDVASALSSLQGVFPDARVEGHYSSALKLVIDEEVEEEPEPEIETDPRPAEAAPTA